MEFRFQENIRELLGGEDITSWTAESLPSSRSSRPPSKVSPFGNTLNPLQRTTAARTAATGSYQQVATIINAMGQASAAAQGLGAVITNAERLSNNPDHVLFIAANSATALGIIKLGTKKLFHRTSNGGVFEITPLCVLDFYVNERCQRQGVGHALFSFALQYFNVQPHQLGYDRPSSKFLSFLNKHHNLQYYEAQNNNFVVFSEYFEQGEHRGRQRSGGSGSSRGSSRGSGTRGSRSGAPATATHVTHRRETEPHIKGVDYSSWFDQQNQQQATNDVLLPMHGNTGNTGATPSNQFTAAKVQQQDSLILGGYTHPRTEALDEQVQQQQQQQQQQQLQQQQLQQSQGRDPVVSSRNYFASGNQHQGAFGRLAAAARQNKNSSTNLW